MIIADKLKKGDKKSIVMEHWKYSYDYNQIFKNQSNFGTKLPIRNWYTVNPDKPNPDQNKPFFFFHHTTCESTCDTLTSSVANQGDNTVSVAQGANPDKPNPDQTKPYIRVYVCGECPLGHLVKWSFTFLWFKTSFVTHWINLFNQIISRSYSFRIQIQWGKLPLCQHMYCVKGFLVGFITNMSFCLHFTLILEEWSWLWTQTL